VFFDHGEVGNHQLLPAETRHLILASAGPGLRYALSPYVTVRFDYGWQLRPSGVSELQRTERGHLGIVVAY
jgi:hemolysin activation/secretion protein